MKAFKCIKQSTGVPEKYIKLLKRVNLGIKKPNLTEHTYLNKPLLEQGFYYWDLKSGYKGSTKA